MGGGEVGEGESVRAGEEENGRWERRMEDEEREMESGRWEREEEKVRR